MRIFGFFMGSKRSYQDKLAQAEKDLQEAREHAVKARQVRLDIEKNREQNHWATIIKQSILNGHE